MGGLKRSEKHVGERKQEKNMSRSSNRRRSARKSRGLVLRILAFPPKAWTKSTKGRESVRAKMKKTLLASIASGDYGLPARVGMRVTIEWSNTGGRQWDAGDWESVMTESNQTRNGWNLAVERFIERNFSVD